jgi:hypothetical protein
VGVGWVGISWDLVVIGFGVLVSLFTMMHTLNIA